MYNAINIAAGSIVIVVLLVVVLYRKRITNNVVLNRNYFQRKWLKLQKLCSDKKTWYKAIIDADALLDEALKQRHFKGKTTGERLVAAQHYFTSNDALWLSHKLRNKITDNNFRNLTKKQTIEALSAFRLALKDIGALGAERKAKSKS